MKKLTERDQDEITALGHYIKYINSKPDCADIEVLKACYYIQDIGEKFFFNGYDKEEINKLVDVEEMNEYLNKLLPLVHKILDKQIEKIDDKIEKLDKEGEKEV